MTPRLTFYGDDFTGSSAVMEVLAFAGIPTVMFLDIPTPAMLARLTGIGAIGIAGVSRSHPPDWMDRNLPPAFAALKALGASILHYKTCSTFDSAPDLGSIGRATELGLAVSGAQFAPLVVGAPAIGRYQIFGTLFAAFDQAVHRLDRHPVMARHPATPMDEADLCRHLDRQTDLPKAIIDWRSLYAGTGSRDLARARAEGARIIAIDAFDEETLAEAGRLIVEASDEAPVFAVGSQGIEYALVAYWRRIGLLPPSLPQARVAAASPLLVVSGSCSEMTARQITRAEQEGFRLLALDARAALSETTWDAALDEIERNVHSTLMAGRNCLVHTARGPQDPAVPAFTEALKASGVAPTVVNARIGRGLGRIVRQARRDAGLSRAVFSGGDTSGHAMLAVGVEALEPLAPLAPGAPLLRIRSPDPAIEGMEVTLKGGQMGSEDFFLRASRGTA